LPEHSNEEGISLEMCGVKLKEGKYDLMPLILPSFAFLAGMIPTYIVNSNKKAYEGNEVKTSLVGIWGLLIAFVALFLVLLAINNKECIKTSFGCGGHAASDEQTPLLQQSSASDQPYIPIVQADAYNVSRNSNDVFIPQ